MKGQDDYSLWEEIASLFRRGPLTLKDELRFYIVTVLHFVTIFSAIGLVGLLYTIGRLYYEWTLELGWAGALEKIWEISFQWGFAKFYLWTLTCAAVLVGSKQLSRYLLRNFLLPRNLAAKKRKN